MYVIEQDTWLGAGWLVRTVRVVFHSEVPSRHIPNDAHQLQCKTRSAYFYSTYIVACTYMNMYVGTGFWVYECLKIKLQISSMGGGCLLW